jgi:hypothetical protein
MVPSRSSRARALRGRALSIVLLAVGLPTFVASLVIWLFARHPLPLWWVVLNGGGILATGWGSFLRLPARPSWATVYMEAVSPVVVVGSYLVSR